MNRDGDGKKPDFAKTTGSYPRPNVPGVRRPTPPPMSLASLPPPPHDDLNAARGAKNVVARCLALAPGETAHIMTYKADALYGLLRDSVEEVGGVVVRVDLDSIEPRGTSAQDYIAMIAPHLTQATATILLAPGRPSAALSLAVAKSAEAAKTRHLHLLQVDDRLLGQSVRADPDLLAIVNGRLARVIDPPCTVRMTSEAGTDLEIGLALKHPILSSAGRPAAGQSENLPAGSVFTHPARVAGTLVVDRAIFGPGISLDRSLVRRAPTRFVFQAGKLVDHDAADPSIKNAIDAYLESHAYAARVGLVVFPTNFLVRSETGMDRQDMLLPGVCVSLGYASADATRANYEAPVQLALLGRRQSVEVEGTKLVDAGRLAHDLVDGIDPFR